MKYIAILLVTAAIATAASDGPTPEKQIENLRGPIVSFAENRLEDGQAVLLGMSRTMEGKTWTTSGPSQYSSDSSVWAGKMRKTYQADGDQGKIAACAIAYCTMEIAPGEKEKTPTLVVELYHREGIALVKNYPYRVGADHKVIFGKEYSKSTQNILLLKSDAANGR